jgi:hypothetical protein
MSLGIISPKLSWRYHFAISTPTRTPTNSPASALTCGLHDMAVNGDAEARAIRRDELRPKLITSSTKRRVHELSGLQHHVADDGECVWGLRTWRRWSR